MRLILNPKPSKRIALTNVLEGQSKDSKRARDYTLLRWHSLVSVSALPETTSRYVIARK